MTTDVNTASLEDLANEYRAFLASPGTNVCRAHGLEVDVRWQPLHPGRR